jgi:beta-lactamase superfamily II metal-dependent hydrolase
MYGFFVLFSILLLIMTFNAQERDEADRQVIQNFQKKPPDEGTKIHFISLTNGEATLIQLENEVNILIDTGAPASFEELRRYLIDKHLIDKLKHVFITNEASEHMGNLVELTQHIEMDHLYFPYHLDLASLTNLQLNHYQLHPLKEGETLRFNELSELHVLNPSQQLSLSPQDNSLVLQFKHGKQRFLFTSAITEAVEKRVGNRYELHSQVLKVSDFGSNQASSSLFLEEVDAHVAIIFHRPGFYLEEAVLERLEESWMDVYPLQRHGHIVIVSEENDYEVFVVPREPEQ